LASRIKLGSFVEMSSARSNLADVTLAILAGGEGSRMGRPKGELTIDGRPILAFLAEHIDWPGPTMLVTAPGREKPAGHERFGREVVDAVSGAGPVQGILTALENVQTPLLVIATIDMPGIGRTQLEWLVGMLRGRADLDLVMPNRLASGKVQAEPFPSAYRAGARSLVEAQLKRDASAAVQSLAKLPRAALVLAPREWPERVWTNLNRPEDLQAFLQSRPRG
jgi:molybdopterin-guanine dinucleotide biosynthesis protein A